MGPSCRGVFAFALSLVFPKVLHFSFSVVFPPDLGWQQPPFQQRGSTTGPERGSVKNQRSLTLKGCHRLPLWDFMGCHSPQRLVQHKHIFFLKPFQWSCSRQIWACNLSLPHSWLECALPGSHHLPPGGNSLDWTMWDSVVEEVFYAHSEFLLIWINNC